MRTRWAPLTCALLLLAVAAPAQTSPANKKKEEHREITQILDWSVENLEHDLIPTAEAMPEDKFAFVPASGEFKGARTYAQQIKHIAAVNYELAAAILGERSLVDINDEAGPESITSRDEILKYLKDSFEYVHKAIATINEKNMAATVKSPFGEGHVSRLSLASSVAWHGFDHYGQMCVYLRLNGIVPPASRY